MDAAHGLELFGRLDGEVEGVIVAMGSVKPSVRHRGVGAPPTTVPQSAGISNGVVNGAAPVSNGYVNHLRNELSEFEKETFDAQGYVQSKCQSMSEKVGNRAFEPLCDNAGED